jgi:glycosyltransferase involved in cell wall biosynthesis
MNAEMKKMKLLIITQKVDINDDILGFIHGWIEKFAENLDKLYIICLVEGKHNLPKNVEVFSLGKGKGYSKLRQFFRFQKFLLKHLREVDGVFCHMCSIYAVLAFPLTKFFRKKLVLWHAHYKKSWLFRLAAKLVDKIVTSTALACSITSLKLRVVGQGIDVEKFKPQELRSEVENGFKILFLGRISPVKDLETLVEAINILFNHKNVKNIQLEIVGSPSMERDKEYLKKIKNLVKELGLNNLVSFQQRVPNFRTPEIYNQADVFVNLTRVGSFDKTTLEAMACEILVLVSNQVFKEIFPENLQNVLMFKEKNPEDLAEKILYLRNLERDKKQIIRKELRKIIIKDHNLNNLIGKIISEYVRY